MSGRTMRQRALVGGVVILIVAMAGCDRAWHACRRPEVRRRLALGASMPVDLTRDLARPGFDRTLRLDNGATIRWRNLGGGHVRIEAKWFRIVDPLLWIIKCELAAEYERAARK